MGARGSTAASESADVVIMTDDISRVARAVEIGGRTLRVAVPSIWIGIALSVVLMGIAAFGYIPALLAQQPRSWWISSPSECATGPIGRSRRANRQRSANVGQADRRA
jgi:hypothetical protein